MEQKKRLHKEENNLKRIPRIDDGKQFQDQASTQENRQNSEQEQNVNANPVQLNTQNFNITADLNLDKYSGKIGGITYLERNKKILPNVNILLYFGNISDAPIYKTRSDENGNYLIEDLPPGYYTILAYKGRDFKTVCQYIKVLIGQNVYQSIDLRCRFNSEDMGYTL